MRPALPCDIEDRYTVTAELGHGSHAIVYKAHDRVLERDVAIKVLREELVDSQVSERFRREIRLTSQLDHPHIAHVYGSGEWRGAPYFVIALATGPSLADRLAREHQLPVDEALGIARDVASALAHAHRASIIHRDVKPANILLTPHGALLTDFGVARALDPGTLATTTGVAVGTLLYMSPEQLCVDNDIDARSDQYALALVIYEMLAGVPPHIAANAEGLRALRIVGQHAPLRAHRTSVPVAVERAIDRALCPTPADRFASMAEFSAALDGSDTRASMSQAGVAHGTVETRPSGRWRRPWTSPAVWGCVALLLGTSVVGVWWLSDDAVVTASDAATSGAAFRIDIEGDTAAAAPVARALAEELRAWPGISAAIGSGVGVPLELRVATVPGALRASVSLRGAARAQRTVQVQFASAGTYDPDSLRVLAARALMAEIVAPDSAATLTWVSGRSLAAVKKFGQAWAALLAGSLEEAESLFAEADRSDAVPQAALWQAIVGSWLRPRNPASWRDVATVAATRHLSAPDSMIADALVLQSTGDMAKACATFASATRVGGGSFEAWYGLADCQQIDSTVVRDANSPTGFRFRTSYWSALRAYGAAIQRLPSERLVPLFDQLPRVALAVNPSQRPGTLLDGDAMQGLPATAGDSVVVYPVSVIRMQTGGAGTIPSTYQSAVRRARLRLLDIATSLATRAPRSLGAQLGYARALEYAGVLDAPGPGATALSTLRRAAQLATNRSDSLQVGLAEARVMLRMADFNGVRTVAERLLARADSASPFDARRLLSLAIIIDRPDVALTLLIRSIAVSSAQPDGLPLPAATTVAGYALAATRGDCARLVALRTAATESLRSTFSPAERIRAEESYLAGAEWLGLTCPGSPMPNGIPATDPLVRAFAALRAGNDAEVGNLLRFMTADRSGVAATSISWDTRFAEVWLSLRSGDSAGARARLGTAMQELPATMDFVLFDPAQGAGFRRSLQACAALSWPPDLASRGTYCREALISLTHVAESATR